MKILEHSPYRALIETQGKKLSFNFRLEESQLQPLFSGSAWGTCIWGASVSLSNYIENHVEVAGLKVLEVGAGYGLCGLCAAIGGAKKVILTDKEPEVDYLQIEIEKNVEVLPSAVVEVERLCWGEKDATEIVNKFGQPDVILVADCVSSDVYGKKSWNDLIGTLDIMSGPSTKVFVCSTKRKDDGFEEFITLIKQRFIKYELVQRETGSDGIFEIYQFQKL